jgi:hypothetical protein
MKTKLIISALLCALSVNVAQADGITGNLGVRHTSDYYYRAAALSEDALQLNVGVGANIAGLDVSVGYLTNQATDAANTDTLSLEIGKTVFDKTLSLAAGVYNMDTPGAADHTQGYISAGLNMLLSPEVTIFRSTSDSLFTYELGVSHGFDLGVADLTLAGVAGRTELTSSTERDYTSASARLSKSFDVVTPHVQVALVDSDTTSHETVVCLGVDFKF